MPYKPLAELSVRYGRQGIERKLWFLEPSAGQPTTAIVFLDAELYLKRVMAVQVLIDATQASEKSYIAAVFVSNAGIAARHVDYVCSDYYAEFVVHDVAAAVHSRYPAIHDRLVAAGLSLSGLAAAHVATRYPDTFRAVICQSPSMWWSDCRFARDVPPARPPAPALWISVGDQETDTGVAHSPSGLYQAVSQIAACDEAVTALRTAGYAVQHSVFPGGHDPDCWREDLGLALRWAFPAHRQNADHAGRGGKSVR